MSVSLAVRRYNNQTLNELVEEIEEKQRIGIRSAVYKGYGALEEQRGKMAARSLVISSVAFSAWCIFSSVLSAYGAKKAYDEFEEEGGFSDGGGSIGGHTAEWWPRVFGSIITSLSWIYFLNNKGMFHHTANLYDRKISEIEEFDDDEKVDTVEGLIDSGIQATEEYRGKIPIFGDEKYVFLPKHDQVFAEENVVQV